MNLRGKETDARWQSVPIQYYTTNSLHCQYFFKKMHLQSDQKHFVFCKNLRYNVQKGREAEEQTLPICLSLGDTFLACKRSICSLYGKMHNILGHFSRMVCQTFFQKTLDNSRPLWYNNQVVREKHSRKTSGCGAAGSALPWGGRGRKFKSCHSDQNPIVERLSDFSFPIRIFGSFGGKLNIGV